MKTPTVLQMESVECGAAALGIVLAHFGRFVPLEELRVACGVSRDGSKASNILKAALAHGLIAKGYRKEPASLAKMPVPMIVHWNFNHFLVLEGFRRGYAYLNDPASGPRVVTLQEFDESFTGVVLTAVPGPDFKQSRHGRAGLLSGLAQRMSGAGPGVAFVALAGLFLVLPGLAIPAFARVFIDDVLIAGRHDWMLPMLIGLAMTGVLRAGLTQLQRTYILRLETRLSLATSSRFLWHILRLPVEFFGQRFAGEIAGRVQANERIAKLLSGEVAATLVDSLTIVFYAAVMFSYDSVLTLVGITLALGNVFALRLVNRKRTDESSRQQRARGQVAGVAMSGLQMMETLKSTGTESEFFAEWSGTYAKAVSADQKLGVYTGYLDVVPPLLGGLTTMAILGLGGVRIMDGHLTVGMLIGFQSLMASFSGPVGKLVTLAGALQEVRADLTRLDDVLRHRPDPMLNDRPEPVPPSRTEVKLAGDLELRGLTYGYSRMDPPLIESFELRVKPGQRVALVGGSGSGKSTIARLVSGLQDPWSGEVLLDGRPRRELPRSLLVTSVALVDQDVFIFGGTIRENLTLWDSTVPHEALVRAARDACIHDDVMARADGYDSVVDERGGNFSGGQRQRLEIARALVGNPSLLILDEATSALDSATEKAIDDNLRRRGLSCLIVAHRLSTIRDCDEIIVLERGRVVQRGTHDEMSAMAGPYARLIAS